MISHKESSENYLETIYALRERRDNVRATDVANALGFSRPSISRALSLLEESGMIVRNKKGHIELTKTGLAKAEEVAEKHVGITAFLESLGVSPDIAEKDACRIEHIISEETFARILSLKTAPAESNPNSRPSFFDPAFAAYYYDDGFHGIKNYDHITFDEIIGYDVQKQKIIDNLRLLVDGKKAENMLFYGDAGTGKSSCAKAALEMFHEDGLRMISTTKRQIDELPKILRSLTDIPCKFIVYIDDLSFEEGEGGYKTLKSIIEGRIERKPNNSIFLVTTNRRNLVRESWKERDGADDMHLADTIAEKHSLANRFAVNLSFMKPDKEEYLNIVLSLARLEKVIGKTVLYNGSKIKIGETFLEHEALSFERRSGGRSGRAARQFIDYLTARVVL